MIDIKKESILLYTEKSIKNNFLIVKNVKINAQSYEFKILQEEKNGYLLQPKLDYEEENEILKYDISNKISLDDYIKSNKLKSNDLRIIIKAINNMLNVIENYLISENSILLDTKSIYIDKINGKCYFSFVPIPDYKSDFSYELSKLLIRLMRYVDVNDKEALSLAYGLFIKSSKDNFTINDLLELCGELDVEDENEMNVIAEDFESLYDGKIREENEYNNYYDLINENLKYGYNNSDISSKHINTKRDNNLDTIKMNNEIEKDDSNYNVHTEEHKDDDDYDIKDSIKMNNKTKAVLLDYFDEDDEEEAADLDENVNDKLCKTKSIINSNLFNKRRKIKRNRQRLSIDSNILKKIIFVFVLVLPIVFCLVFGGLQFFYENIVKILFLECFVLLFILFNNVLNLIFKKERKPI